MPYLFFIYLFIYLMFENKLAVR